MGKRTEGFFEYIDENIDDIEGLLDEGDCKPRWALNHAYTVTQQAMIEGYSQHAKAFGIVCEEIIEKYDL